MIWGKQVFITSPWVPAEWIKAHGLEPRGVWFAPAFAFEALPLAAGACAFASAVIRLAETQPDSAVVFTTHCDQLRRGFDATAWKVTEAEIEPASSPQPSPPAEEREKPRQGCTRQATQATRQEGAASSLPATRVFLFNLPATWQSDVAENLFCAELARLGKFLLQLGGHAPETGELALLIEQHASGRARLLAASGQCQARAYAEAVARFHWDGSAELPGESPARREPAVAASVPLALVGGPLPRAQWALLELIESAGGRVVLNATEAGERSLWADTDEPTDQPPTGRPSRSADFPSAVSQTSNLEICTTTSMSALLSWLARDYLAHCVDVFQRPNTRLYQWLQARLASRGVRGIILWHYVGCDLWQAEAQSLREAFGLPVLLLDVDETASGRMRQAGRLQAFVESLR